MNETLKAVGSIGAELGAAKAECERLRGLLNEVLKCQRRHYGDGMGLHLDMITLATRIDAALAEPQGERVPAQDERESPIVVGIRVSSDGFGSYIADSAMGIGALYPGDVRDPLMTVAQHERIVAALTRPAQTEQQPGQVVAYRTLDRYGNPVTDWIDGSPVGGDPIVSGGSFQLAQTAPQPEQSDSALLDALLRGQVAAEKAGMLNGTANWALCLLSQIRSAQRGDA